MLLPYLLHGIVAFASSVTASAYVASIGSGPALSQNAHIDKDITRTDSSSRTFNILYNYWAEASLARQLDWQWSINITEIAATGLESEVSNQRILSTEYSYSWPNVPEPADTLRDKLAQYEEGRNVLPERRYVNASSYCVTIVESLFPALTTNTYNASSSLCRLPVNCMNAMTRAWLRAEDRDEQGCRGINNDPTRFDECDGVFGKWNATTINIAAPDTGTIANGTAFYHRTTSAYDPSNSTTYDEERLRLHMIITDSGTEFDVRCQRIDATPLANDESVGAAVAGATRHIAADMVLASLAVTATLFYLL